MAGRDESGREAALTKGTVAAMRTQLLALALVVSACSGNGGDTDAGAGGGTAATGGGTAEAGGGSTAAGGGTATTGGGTAATGGGGGTAAAGGGTADAGGGTAATGGGTGATGGGVVDAGDPFSPDRNLFFGDSRCADAGFALCEDFESGTINTAIWQKSGGQFLSVGAAESARGTHALHIHIPALADGGTTNGAAYLKETKTFPAPNNTYYGRAFYKFIQIPAAPMMYSHWTVMGASGTVIDGEIRISAQLGTNGKNIFGVGTDNRVQDAGTGDWTNSDKDPNNTPRAVPTNEWECLEWLHDGANNETRFYWDDVEHPSLHTTLTMHGGIQTTPFVLPDFANVFIGYQEYQTTTEPFELWVDEIAIDPQRIGCVR